MRSVESTGKSVDEAIFKGLQELGISIDEVDIELIKEETKGVFGIGSKPAHVRLTEREAIKFTEKFKPFEEGVKPQREATRPANREKKPVPKQGGARRRNAPRHEQPLHKEVIPYSKEVAEKNEGARFLSRVLQMMNIEAKVTAVEVEDALRICIQSSAMGILIGHRGETLDSLQYLVSLVINKNRHEGDYTRVVLDTENYRKRREETLSRLAKRLASRVKSTGEAITLEPMNPYERRVLHSTLQSNPYVTTHSEGEGPNRRVIISPIESPSQNSSHMGKNNG